MAAAALRRLSSGAVRGLSTRSYEAITAEVRPGKVGLLTLNRPKALNALSPALVSELAHAAAAFDADPEIG